MSQEGIYPIELRYNPEHTWLRIEPDGKGRVGITYYAQKQLKQVVFVELPEVGKEVTYMEPFGVIESAKATNDLYSPASGSVVEVNQALITEPDLVNRNPYGQGWMIVIELSNPDEISRLMSAETYHTLIGGKS
jgi:glycine cleavage system H protein